jgi:ATP-dependent DNA helicase RecQ
MDGMDAVLTALARAGAALPGDPGAAAVALADARAGWEALDGDERRALAPLGRLLADRLAAARTAVAAGGDDGDEAGAMLAHYGAYAQEDGEAGESLLAPPEGPAPADPSIPAAPAARRAVGIHGAPAPEVLLERFGLPAFRPGQREAVQAALDGRDSLVVMPTGGGKSLCYQLPAAASDALTVVVSPLIALIADQHRRLEDAGVRAVMLASTLGEEANRTGIRQIREGGAQVVFCAPERFASRALRQALAERSIALFVVDEAHCVTEWGHDFRPDYLRLRPVIEELGRPPVMAATATATPRVAAEVASRLGLRDPVLVRRGFDRPNLSFDVLPFAGDGSVARKRATLLAGLRDPANRPAVVYCGTRKDTDEVRALVQGAGIPAVAYHAGMGAAERQAAQDRFMGGACEVVVATNAFGMGVDKADIRSVWHWALPTSVEAYYQEAGRAGRDGRPARAVLLAMRGDLGRLIQFIRASELGVADVERLCGTLRRGAGGGDEVEVDPRSLDDRARVALGVAERAGAAQVAPAPGGRLAVRLSGRLDVGAARAVCREATGRRWDAYQALKRFAGTDDVCRRRQLLDHFGDDEPGAPEGRCCDVCDPVDWLVVPATAPRASRGPAVASGPPVDERELDALKAWRLGRADGKPAYTVAANAALEEILRRRPGTAAELLDIKGIGPAFVERHGESLLAELGALAVT